MLKVSDDLSLPIEAVTQTFAVLAKRGAGKSYLASVMAEEMLAAHQQIVVIDPTSAWRGLRSSADGRSPGYHVVVIGAEHADVPLSEMAGEVIAQAVVEHRFSAIIDLSQFRKGQVRRFLTPFLETLYRLNREPLHLFVDEADDVCPQKPFGDEAQMVGAMEDVVKRGRRKGIGCTLITQRPADLAKQVLTQCEVLVPLRLSHPRDISAIKEWINVHAEPDQAKQVIASLPSLPIGTAWVWSPGWLDKLVRIRVRKRQTFDSSATPKVGEAPRKPKKLAEIDVRALGEQIAATVEEAKANEPRELKRRIATLEKQLASRPAAKPARLEVPVLGANELDALRTAVDRMEAALSSLAEVAKAVSLAATRASTPQPTRAIQPRPTAKPVAPRETIGGLSAGERKVLTAIAQYDKGVSRETLTVLTGYKRSSRDTYLQRLRSQGHIEQSGDTIFATPAGVDALGDGFKPLPIGSGGHRLSAIDRPGTDR